jgi:hypothetical protein
MGKVAELRAEVIAIRDDIAALRRRAHDTSSG